MWKININFVFKELIVGFKMRDFLILFTHYVYGASGYEAVYTF